MTNADNLEVEPEELTGVLAGLSKLTQSLLFANPDITLMWNIRKEILQFTKRYFAEAISELMALDYLICLKSNFQL